MMAPTVYRGSSSNSKRKRSSTANHETTVDNYTPTTSAQCSAAKRNPFLPKQGDDDAATTSTTKSVLPLVLQFLEASSKKPKRQDISDDNKNNNNSINEEDMMMMMMTDSTSRSSQLADSIAAIISFYQSDKESPSSSSPPPTTSPAPATSSTTTRRPSSLLSQSDVAGLLLPWAMNQLLRYTRLAAPPIGVTTITAAKNDVSNTDMMIQPPSLLTELQALVFCLETLVSSTTATTSTTTSTTTTLAAATATSSSSSSSSSLTAVAQTLTVGAASSSSSLTQSNLHKLVPWTMRMALQQQSTQKDDSHPTTTTISDICTKAYCLLVDYFYRPTLDVACSNLLPILAKSYNEQPHHVSDTSNAGPVMTCTLRLLGHLLDAGNPKKNFTLLAAPLTFLALARIYYQIITTLDQSDTAQHETPPPTARTATATIDTADDTSSAKHLFRQIVQKAWFQASQHVDGFRSMNRPVLATDTSNADNTIQPLKPTLQDHANPIFDDSHPPPMTTDSATTTTTTPAARIFHCYQENLLDTIQTILVKGVDDPSEERTTTTEDKIHVIHLLPLLLEVFVEQSKAYWNHQQQHQQKGHSKNAPKSSSTLAELSSLQFRVWAYLMAPVVSVLLQKSTNSNANDNNNTTEHLTSIQSICKGLQLMVQHQMYRPSHHDHDDEDHYERSLPSKTPKSKQVHKQPHQPPKQTHRQCVILLRHVAQALLMNEDYYNNQSPNKTLDSKSECCTETIRALHLVLQLNHRLLHDRLGQVIALAAHHQEVAKSFACAVIQTYSRLRQLDHLVACLLEAAAAAAAAAATRASASTDSTVGSSLPLLLRDSSVAAEMAKAMESCPIDQVRTLCEMLNQSIVSSATDENTIVRTSAVSTSVEVLVLLFRNVRVDSYTSSKVVALFQQVMEGAAATLLPTNASDQSGGGQVTIVSPNAKQGLMLCGWAMDLQLRCAFWQEQEISTVQPTDVISSSSSSTTAKQVLHAVVASFRQIGNENSLHHVLPESLDVFSDELHFLAGYRIQQLHSQIYESQRISNSNAAEEPSASEGATNLTIEAQHLTGFFVGLAGKESALAKADKTSRWTRVAQRAPHWAPYAEPEHIRSFLRWLFSTLSSIADACPTGSEVSDQLRKTTEEIEVATSLIGDASFYELSPIAQELHSVCMECFANEVQRAFSVLQPESKSKWIVEGVDLFDHLALQLRGPTFGATFARLLRIGRSVDRALVVPKENSQIRSSLVRALMLLDLWQGLPFIVTAPDAMICHFIAFLMIDVTVDIVLKNLPNDDQIMTSCVLRIASKLRVTLSTCCDRFREVVEPVTDYEVLSGLVLGVIQSTKEVARRGGCLDLIRASGELIRTVLGQRCFNNSLPLKDLTKEIIGLFDGGRNENERLSVVVLCRYFVSGVLNSFRLPKRCEASSNLDAVDIIGAVKESLWPVVTGLLQAADGGFVQAESLLLLGEIIRALPLNQNGSGDTTILEFAEKAIVRHLKCDLTQSAALYVVASFDPKRISSDMKMRMIEQLVTTQFQDQKSVHETAFIAMISDASETELKTLLEIFSGRKYHLPTRSKVRFTQLLLMHTDHESHHEFFGEAARDLFFTDVDLLYPALDEQEAWAEDVVLSLTSLCDLCRTRDFLLLKERELALVLSKINSVLARPSNHKLGPRVPSDVFGASYKLLMVLMQRFPKQLANCVPCVISVLQVMLRQSLRGPHSGPEMIDRGQKLGRLCEALIPHKDIYKKHVLGLLIDFIDALKGDMHPNCKKVLLPAVFCLLDLLSQYETQQLNALIDETGKSLFRSVFEDYQSAHVYKGQY